MKTKSRLILSGVLVAMLAVFTAGVIFLSAFQPTVQAAGVAPQAGVSIYLPVILNKPVPLPVLQNADFDLGHVAWTETSSNSHTLIKPAGTGGSPSPHSGSWGAWLGGIDNETSDLAQQITIPTGTGPFYLHFYYQIASFETNCSQSTPSDGLYLYVNDTFVDGIVICNAFSTGATWVPFSFIYDLSANAGQTVTLHIKVITNESLASSVFLDTLYFKSSP